MAFKAKVSTLNLLMLVKTSLALLMLLLTIHDLPESMGYNFSPFLLGSSYKLGVVSYSSQPGSIGWSSPEVREHLDLGLELDLDSDSDLDSDEDQSHRFSSNNDQTGQELDLYRLGHNKLHHHHHRNHHHDHHRHQHHHNHHHHHHHHHHDENKHHNDLREYSEEQSVENNQRCHDKRAQDSLMSTLDEEPAERYQVEQFLVGKGQEEKNIRKEFDTEQSSRLTKRHRHRQRRRRRRAQASSSKFASSNDTQIAASGGTLRNTTTSGHKQSMATNKVAPEEIGRQVQLALNEKQSRFKSQSQSQPESQFQFQFQSLSKFKRESAEQELDLAVNRLHILESLDAQLRQFVDNAALVAENSTTTTFSASASTLPLTSIADLGGKGYNPSTETTKQPIGFEPEGFRFGQGLVGLRPEGATNKQKEEDDNKKDNILGQDEEDEFSDETCVLMLNWAFEAPSTSEIVGGKSKKPSSCLANPQLKRQIPPYMLNLYLQLRAESRSLAEATKLMPYQSVVMRSFRQPKLDEDDDDDDYYYNHNSDDREHKMVEPDRKTNNNEWAGREFGERDDDRSDGDADENEVDNEGERQKYSIEELIVEGGGEEEEGVGEEEGEEREEAGRQVRRFDATNHLLTRGSQVESESESENGNGNGNKRTLFGQVKRAEERKASAARSNNKSRNLVVVELNALPDGHHFEEKSLNTTTTLNSEKWPKFESDKVTDSNGGQQEINQVASSSSDKLPALSSPKTTTTTTLSQLSPSSSSSPPAPQTACKLSERSFEVHKRSELCYWFRISEQLRRKINGSLVRTKTSSSTKRERLVEAELHVFKLLPELLQNTRDRGYFGKNSNGVSTTTQIASKQLASSSLGISSGLDSRSSGLVRNSNSTLSPEWKLKTSRRIGRKGRTKTLNRPSSLMVNGSSLYANQVRENIAEGESIANEPEKSIVNEEERKRKVELRTRIESAKQEQQKQRKKQEQKQKEKQQKHSENKKQNLLSSHRQMSDGYTQVKNPTVVRTLPLVTYTNSNQVRSQHTNSLYHLKTNLLEVSLYQILPKKSQDLQSQSLDSVSNNTSKSEQRQQQREEEGISSQYPLRLLDIRRIDLDSSGWETFYVKRAVEDWISDSSLNLGLVIKAKSMFEEPIKIGLIRFADLYDHKKVSNKVVEVEAEKEKETEVEMDTSNNNNNNNDGGQDKEDKSGAKKRKTQIETDLAIERQRLEAQQDFDSSHQPILVIYTSLSPSEN